MHKYQITIWWSEENAAFLAMVPELPRLIVDGPTPQAALAEAQSLIDFFLELYTERGDPAPQPAGKLLPVRDEFDWKDATPPAPQPEAAQQSEPAPSSSVKNSTKSKPRPSRAATGKKSHVHA